MNSHTNTKTAQNRRHRLYVAVPLFVFFAWLGLPQSGHNMPADLSTIRSEEDGLIAGKSIVTATINDLTLSGWNGAFHIDAASTDRVTIAALTTPVVATRSDVQWIVPVGMQLTIDADASSTLDASWLQNHRPQRLPVHYVREMLPKVEVLMERVRLSALPAAETTLPPLLGSALRFDAAENRAWEQETALRLSVLTQAMQESDDALIDELLLRQDTQQALQHAPVQQLWTVLSLAAASNRDALILPFLLDDADAALIARYHPLLSDRAWVYPGSDTDRSALLLQILLPQSDRAGDPRPEAVIRAWQDGWQALVKDEAQATFIRETVLPLIREDIVALDRDGYPARARAYSDALAAAFGSEQEVIVDARVDIAEEQIDEAEERATEEPEVTQEIISEDQVRKILSDLGVMFTSKSALSLNEDGSYAIRDIVMGTNTGDRVLSFTYQPSRDLVSGIEHEGKILPYSLSLEQYLTWVRGEK